MISFPNCKINLGLHITGKRPDGYHNLETIFYPIAFTDALEVVQSDRLQFHATGLPIYGDADDNLCLRAYQLLKQDFPAIPAVSIHLHKAIPMGAGLGGGSSDGAFMLSLLNEKFRLGLTTEKLVTYALQLGSDCPFFILNQPSLGQGRGEILTPVAVDLSGYRLMVVNPGIHVPTREAFAGLRPTGKTADIRHIVQRPVGEWRGLLINDFEQSVFTAHPEIARLKERLYASGAIYASMTGSGSTVYGFFPAESSLPDMPENYTCFVA